jgi:hypothetical protein
MTAVDEWEPVHTVEEFFDQPRRGFADYRGRPHTYECEWDEQADDWGSTYLLSPVSEEQLALAKENWAIFERWLMAHHEGSLSPDDKHPALAADRSRQDELGPLVAEALAINKVRATRAAAEFRGGFAPLNLQVSWRDT